MKKIHPEIYAKGKPEWTTLYDHLTHVVQATESFAEYLGMDTQIARLGAILHDIGKVSPIFQARLKGEKSLQTYRHEISSLFFLPLVPLWWHGAIIEMIIAHHKAIELDHRQKGILDLLDHEPKVCEYHLGDWETWSPVALEILAAFDVPVKAISREQAIESFKKVEEYCLRVQKEYGFSEWRGLLMGADHFASAMIHKTEDKLKNLFQVPCLTFFNRQSPDYPLSLYEAGAPQKHTMVIAPTGAGKTDFLFRRCRGRVFYTLPFQASINAMFQRLGKDLKQDNPELNLKLLHAASSLVKTEDSDREDTILQRHMGAAIKVLTPYQMAGIIFAQKGYEAMILDLKGCDIILDEVHTYGGIAQAMVLRIVAVLKSIGCRIHIGTATIPSLLYEKIKQILGPEDVLEVQLKEHELAKYDRHTIHKLAGWESILPLIRTSIERDEKLLIVCNTIQKSQEITRVVQTFLEQNNYSVPTLLLHSKFKRKHRREKEQLLIGLDEKGNPTKAFNTSEKACIVISTQVVEVSLDISFDIMITECAPLDAMIQRFGRINRKRNKKTIGTRKPIYIIQPAETEKEVRPYGLEAIQKSFEVLKGDAPLHETELQAKIDTVFNKLEIMDINAYPEVEEDGTWNISKLQNGNTWLVEVLSIDSVSAIMNADTLQYQSTSYGERMGLEIPVTYFQVKHLPQIEEGNSPYVIPDHCYDELFGLSVDALKSSRSNPKPEIL